MHIVILAPSDRTFIARFLPNQEENKLPKGYSGAPFIGTIIDELLKNNHKVTAITTSVAIDNDYEIKKFTYNNFEWIVVPSRPHSFRMNGKKIGRMLDLYSFEINRMSKVIKDVSPNIVHAHWSYEFAGAALKSGFPHLVTVHDNAFQVLYFFKNLYRLGRLIMSELILRKVKYASTVSPYMLEYTRRNCKNVKIIPNPTIVNSNILKIETAISKKLASIKSPRVIMINNGWDERKNGKSGLIAFKQLHTVFPEATLHLYGNGSEIGGSANKDALSLNVENVYYYGLVSHKILIEELSKAHILVHPSLEESFGLILIEALSFGIPAIGGTNSGAVPWVLNDKRLLVDVSKPQEISNKMVQIINDIKLYKDIGITGFNNVFTRFSSKSVVNAYIDYYEKILEHSNNNKSFKCNEKRNLGG